MSTPFSGFSNDEIRSLCKEHIETLEHWLRRLVDQALVPSYRDYFTYVDSAGNRLVRTALSKDVDDRMQREPERYARKIDAVLLDDLIYLICHPKLFRQHFADPLRYAFPEGAEEARTFLTRLLDPRHRLAHANPISVRQAEQVLCYTGDVIDSIKKHYRETGMQQEFNVPEILRFTDSFGASLHRSQFGVMGGFGRSLDFSKEPTKYVRPGNTLTIEVEVDPSFSESSYMLKWATPSKGSGFETEPRNRLTLEISNREVGESFQIVCFIQTLNDWHRWPNSFDDYLTISYKGLPPLR